MPNYWGSTGTWSWGRQFRVKIVSYKVNPSTGAAVSPATECCCWADNRIDIAASNPGLTTVQETNCKTTGSVNVDVSSVTSITHNCSGC